MSSAGVRVDLLVDGSGVAVRADGTLLDALREDVGKTCVKDGCAPQGQCGACSVLVDGEPRLACVTPIARVAGCEVTTVEGLAEPLRTRLAEAFAACGAFDCGFCTPGIVVRAHAMLNGREPVPPPGRSEIGRALAANLCRCTGWEPVVEAVRAASSGAMPSDPLPDAVRSTAEPLGAHLFLADRADVDWWAVPVVAESTAGRFEGVAPGAVPGRLLAAAELGGAGLLMPGDLVTRVGAVGALALGRTLSEARRSAASSTVRVSRAVPEAAPSVAGPSGWQTVGVDPCFLEPEAAFARLDGATMRVVSQTETPEEEGHHLEHSFPGLAFTLTVDSNGGSYGGKAGPGPAGLAVAAARAVGAGVMCVLGRRESIMWHPWRHPSVADVDLAVDAAGVLLRIDGRVVFAGGGAEIGPTPYRCPVTVLADVVEGRGGGRLRAEGQMQWTFALERAADRLGVDRVASLHAAGAACVSAVEGCGGVAVAGSPGAAVAAGVDLGARGEISRLVVSYSGGADTRAARNAILSGAYMGVGLALSERVPLREGVPTPASIRSLGMLRLGSTPPTEVRCAAPGTSREPLDAYAVAAVPPAVANAVRARDGTEPGRLPLDGTPPAAAVRRR